MIRNYIKITWKVLGRNKFFSFVSLFGISFTIGILLVITTFIENVASPYYPEFNREKSLYLFQITTVKEEGDARSTNLASYYFIDKYLRKLKTPELISFASPHNDFTTFQNGKKQSIALSYTDANFWNVNNFQFIEGKPYQEDQIKKNEQVAVITEATRDIYFGEGNSAFGKTISANSTTYKIIGVVKNVAITQLITYADIYVPYSSDVNSIEDQSFLGNYFVTLLAKNKSDFDNIKNEFGQLVESIELPPGYKMLVAKPYSYLENMSRFLNPAGEPLLNLLLGIIGGGMFLFILLPALNLINLNSSRIRERSAEIGVRKAFGATSSNLAIQFIIENIILTLIGGAIGFLLAVLLINIIESSGIVPYADLGINMVVFTLGILFCLLFGIFSGVLPALKMANLNVVDALRDHNSQK